MGGGETTTAVIDSAEIEDPGDRTEVRRGITRKG